MPNFCGDCDEEEGWDPCDDGDGDCPVGCCMCGVCFFCIGASTVVGALVAIGAHANLSFGAGMGASSGAGIACSINSIVYVKNWCVPNYMNVTQPPSYNISQELLPLPTSEREIEQPRVMQ
jgi:hypothetical protein